MQKEYIGENSIQHLNAIIEQEKAQNIALFCGKNSFEKYKDVIIKHIPCAYDVFNDFEVNPKLEQVQELLHESVASNYDMLVAVGGGSVIDFAKLYKYYGKLSAPLVAIPTTAGTGSEATQFAVMYVHGEKQSIDDAMLYPNYSIVDAAFLLGTPRYIKACTAMDAYCQALESYWAVASTAESQVYAKESICLAHKWLKKFVNSDDLEAAVQMALASNLAGKAIQISRTTAAHALCYKLTTDYNIPHGHAVALSMMDLFAANTQINAATCQDPRGEVHVQKAMQDILHMLGTQDFKTYWKDLNAAVGLEMSFKALGVTNRDEMFSTVNAQRLKNNPKDITKDLISFWQH